MASLWESTRKRIRTDTWRWLQNHPIAWVLAFVVPGGGSVIVARFIPSTMNSALVGLLGGLVGLGLLLICTLVAQSILVFRKQRDEARKLYEPIGELANIKSGDTVKEKDINVSLMFQQLKTDHVINITFEHCVLRGPCIVGFQSGNSFYATDFGSRFADRLIKCEKGKRYFGVAAFVNCKFNFCEFVDTSFLMTEEGMKLFLSKVVQL
jgi:hypothetical protein